MPSLRSTPLIAVIGAVVLSVSACYSGAPSSAEPSAPVASLPAETSPTSAGCPNFVEVVETGPMAGDDGTEDGPVAREQQRLDADVQAAVAYGAEHPNEFASVRYENGPRVRIVIGFTARVEEHCAALRAILEFPDEFEIIRQPATEARLLEIQQEIVALAGDRMRSVGIGAGTIDLQLRADGEAIADEARARYGDIVDITVGLLGFPDRSSPPGSSCADLVTPSAADLPLQATVALEAPQIGSGEDFTGVVAVRNIGESTFAFQSGPTQIAQVFTPGSEVPSGLFTGGLDSLGFGRALGPGESVTLKVVGGTASCDPTLGYALPPGLYEVRVTVLQLTMHDNAPTETAYLLSEPVPLTIVP